jgi:putative iron-dependent peroxidase
MTAQPGIVAMGTSEHLYLQGDITGSARDRVEVLAEVLGTVLAVVEDLSTTAGANVVVGIRPELWPGLVDGRPLDAIGFTEPIFGTDGFTMPATQTDFWLWASAGSRTATFDVMDALREPLAGLVVSRSERDGWAYRGDRDLTGFIDGTENPSALEALDVIAPGGSGSIVLVQTWTHDAPALAAMSVREQELMMGRSKADSVELEAPTMPADAHVARTKVLDAHGAELHVFRRNTATGTPTRHGTNFVGFAADRSRLQRMLEQMAGVPDGVRDALTRVAVPVDGSYFYVPPVEELRGFAARVQ